LLQRAGGIKEGDFSLEAAKPEFQGSFFEKETPALRQLVLGVGRGENFYTNFRGD
jgi:hypothetical protein